MSAAVSDVSVAPAPTPTVTVVQAIPKGDRAELAVEVLTEVGVDRIVPWAAARCVGIWRGDRAAKSLARWRATARESGQAVAALLVARGDRDGRPRLRSPPWSRRPTWPSYSTRRRRPRCSSLPLDGVRSIVVVVGPEGGITDEELAQLGAAHVVRMGESVLRTSTAGVAAVAALLSRTPRWGSGSTAYDAPSGIAGRENQ